MGKTAALAAAAGLSLAAVVKGDFMICYEQAPGVDPGTTRTTWYALSTNHSIDVGTKALGVDLTLKDLSGHSLATGFVSASPTAKADLTGVAASDPYHSDRSFVNLLGDPSGGSSGTDNDPTAFSVVSTTPTNTHANFANGVQQFEVVGANLNGGVDATSAANGGRGALIAVAVAPTGDVLELLGQIGGNLPGSPAQTIDAGFPPAPQCPEPSALALTGVGLASILTRRRRSGA